MRHDTERGVLHLVIDRVGWGKEEQVAVEIGHPLRIALVFQHVQHPGRRAGEIIFDRGARRARRGHLRIGSFEIRKSPGHEVRQIERGQRPVASLAQAEDPEPGSRRMLLQRLMESEPARQVVVVEIGTIDALGHDARWLAADKSLAHEAEPEMSKRSHSYRNHDRVAMQLHQIEIIGEKSQNLGQTSRQNAVPYTASNPRYR